MNANETTCKAIDGQCQHCGMCESHTNRLAETKDGKFTNKFSALISEARSTGFCTLNGVKVSVDHEIDGQGLGQEKWKKAPKAAVVRLYRNGKVQLSGLGNFIRTYQLKLGDHAQYIRSIEGRVSQEQLIKTLETMAENGVNLSRLETVSRQQESRLETQQVKQVKAQQFQGRVKEARQVAIVKDGRTIIKTVKGTIKPQASKPMTEGERALLEYELAEKRRQVECARKENGYEVRLSEKEKQALIEKTFNKPVIQIKEGKTGLVRDTDQWGDAAVRKEIVVSEK